MQVARSFTEICTTHAYHHDDPSTRQRQVHDAVGDKDVGCSDWKTSTNQFGKIPDHNEVPVLADLRPGCVRRIRFSGFSMGSKFQTDELVQLEEVVPGSCYRLEICVATTATYGDKFRPVLRHALRAVGPTTCTLQIVATVVFVGKINGFIKGMIDRGAKDGMMKNYAAFRKALQNYAAVSDAKISEEVPTAPPVAPGVSPAVPQELPCLAALVDAVGEGLERATASWATALQRLLGLPTVGGVVLHVTLCVLCVLVTLQMVMQALLFLQRASQQPTDVVSGVTHMAFKVESRQSKYVIV